MAQKVNSSSQDRIELKKVIPLGMPFAVHIFPSYYCDFRCCYCIHSLDAGALSRLLPEKRMMDMETYRNAIDGLDGFKGKLKLLNFAGHGEPLLNRYLAEMIAYAQRRNIAERIELVTNAHTLTESVSDALIGAGLDSIRISIQGITAAKYRSISNTEVDFNRLVEQIRYFYEHKQKCRVYIKTVDRALDSNMEEQCFYEIFGNICDHIAVEHIVPTAGGVEYYKQGYVFDRTQQGYVPQNIEACPMPFYMLIVEPNGNIRTCCAASYPILLGNVGGTTLFEAWKSDMLREFQEMQLADGRKVQPVCSVCKNPDYGIQPGDVIDDARKEILKRIRDLQEEKHG